MHFSLMLFIFITEFANDLHIFAENVRNNTFFEHFYIVSEQNCFHSEYSKSRVVFSLTHCGMICLMRRECLLFSFDKDENICRLHTFLAASCSEPVNETQVTFQRNHTGSINETQDIFQRNNTDDSCLIQTNQFIQNNDRNVNLTEVCRQPHLEFPLLFDVWGLGDGSIEFITKYPDNPFNQMETVKVLFRITNNAQADLELTVSVAFFPIIAYVDFKDPLKFWIQLEEEDGGGTIVRMGEGHEPEHNIVYNASSLLVFDHIIDLSIENLSGQLEWKFYRKG